MNSAELATLLNTNTSASFLRLGDGELRFLLECFSGEWVDDKYDSVERVRDPKEARGTLGLRRKDFERLCAAYERAAVTDLYSFVPFNSTRLHELSCNLKIGNPVSSAPSHILINEWTATYLKAFLKQKKVLFCGGESRLLEELLKSPGYRDVSNEFWPHQIEAGVYFCHPPDNGRDPSGQLDAIKDQLLSTIRREKIDAVILSLGGIAKILAAEVSTEARVVAIDFGGMMRALVYSGSDGHAFWRSTHNPFLFRVPLEVWLDALERANPDLSDADRISKAQCQLTLDLQRKQIGRWINSDVHDANSLELNSENVATFQKNFDHYRERFRRFLGQSQFRPLTIAFEDWCHEKSVPGINPIGPTIRKLGRRFVQKISTLTLKSRLTSEG
jgi:hypothetical protein